MIAPILSVQQVRQVEQSAAAGGLDSPELMERAGRALATRVAFHLQHLDQSRITVLVGPGNNGGDGLVAARVLAEEGGYVVRCYLLKDRAQDDPLLMEARKAGIQIAVAASDRDSRVLRNMVASADAVIDALFGVGVSLPLRAEAAKLLRLVRAALYMQEQPLAAEERLILPHQPPEPPPLPLIIAADCPSGLNADTGEMDPATLTAVETVTFITPKPGLFLFPGAAAVGRLSVATLGLPDKLFPSAVEMASLPVLMDGETVRAWLPARSLNSNKGTYGKALLVAGSERYVGAAALAALAACRIGTGLVTVAAPRSVVASLSAFHPEPVWLPLSGDGPADLHSLQATLSAGCSALLIGPGLGQVAAVAYWLQGLLPAPGSDSLPLPLPPLLLDADALNLLSALSRWWERLPPQTIITPHPGEMARLSGMTVEDIQADRWGVARRAAREWGAVVLLKGAHSVVAAPDGRLAVLPFKTDALATAGTGDVLAGMILGLRAQGLAAFESAVTAAYLHGLAGELAAQQVGSSRAVIAGDVRDQIAVALARFEISL